MLGGVGQRDERKKLAAELKKINERLGRIAQDRSLNGPEIFDLDHSFHRLLVDIGSGRRLNALGPPLEPITADSLSRLQGAAQPCPCRGT